jgi:hypothetical protein
MHNKFEQLKKFELVFEVTISVPTKAAAESMVVYEQFNQQVLSAVEKTENRWGETEQDTSEYEGYQWMMTVGGRKPALHTGSQKIKSNFQQRPAFTLSYLKKAANKYNNPLNNQLLLIIGMSPQFLLINTLTLCFQCPAMH